MILPWLIVLWFNSYPSIAVIDRVSLMSRITEFAFSFLRLENEAFKF